MLKSFTVNRTASGAFLVNFCQDSHLMINLCKDRRQECRCSGLQRKRSWITGHTSGWCFCERKKLPCNGILGKISKSDPEILACVFCHRSASWFHYLRHLKCQKGRYKSHYIFVFLLPVQLREVGWEFSILMFAAGVSEKQTANESQRSQNQTIEVGPGNLKLVYSGKDGKLTKYINIKSLVC